MPRRGDGRKGHPLYVTWQAMRQRCNNPGFAKYHLYGGRGIKVTPQWDDFWQFVADVGPKPATGKWTLDRIDNEGDYEPGNVRWATYSEQNANRRKLNYPVPDKCRRGHDYVPFYDSRGFRSCKQCVDEHNRARSLADWEKRKTS